MFNKREVDKDFENLYEYLSLNKYPYINQALEYYNLSLNGYMGFCFKKDKKLILSVLYVIGDSISDISFKDKISFAERLFNIIDSNIEVYLDNLRVCLSSEVLVSNFDKFLDVYLLFENKLMVCEIIKYLKLKENRNMIIDYIRKARRYYVDERAFYSAILTAMLNDDLDIDKELEIDKWNAGLYDEDIRKLVKKLER